MRFWHPEEGWSGTSISGPLDAGSRPDVARPGGMGMSRRLVVAAGVALLLLVVFVGVMASRVDWKVWLVGPPLPSAPPLPPGVQVVEVIDSWDSDAGWIGIRGSAFTTDWSADRVHDFFGRQYPASEGWREVAYQQSSESDGLTYRCRARLLNADGDWESVLQISGPANGRFVVTRAEMRDNFWPLEGAAPTMEGCLNTTGWASPYTVFDWVEE